MRILQGARDEEITGICIHSQDAKPGSVFVCIKGERADGHDYVAEAVSSGANVVICDRPVEAPDGVTVAQTEDTRLALALMSAALYDYPAKGLVTVAVTGTKGKTTTTYMIRSILKAAGIRAGLIGTVEVDTGKRRFSSDHTTPEAHDFQRYLREMADSGCAAAVCEVSSQAVKMRRIAGITFDFGVFTNIEEDHIGPAEHRDFDEYLQCKATLFSRCKRGIFNGDDPNLSKILAGQSCAVETFGMGTGCDLKGSEYSPVRMPGRLGAEFCVKGTDDDLALTIGACGEFTCYNALAAIAVCRHFGVSATHIKKGLANLRVPGRQEMFPVSERANCGIIMVDYAHNGTALRSLLQALRAYEPSRLTCVFGCGGQRDPGRRLQMAKAAAAYADFSVITSDNPREENPQDIIGDITDAMDACRGNYMVAEDRAEAIFVAVRNCRPGEITVIAGKGHEDYQLIGCRKIHFDDREEVLKSIEKVHDEKHYNRRN